jgi:transketolase
MAAAMNGIALHGGLIPYSGGFMIFSDYCRPSIRLAALMGIRVIHVLTHDSIGVGEDGPTHEPVEHMAALRAIPNLLMFRPADAVETAECWQQALKEQHRPSGLALTRQNLAPSRLTYSAENLCAKGAYELIAADNAKVSIFASGSEVELAVKAAAELNGKGIATRVVSVPCFELFQEQPDDYRKAVIGDAPVKIAAEAAVRQGWDYFIGNDGDFVGMHSFGASGPAKDLFKHFGITSDAIVAAAEKKLA